MGIFVCIFCFPVCSHARSHPLSLQCVGQGGVETLTADCWMVESGAVRATCANARRLLEHQLPRTTYLRRDCLDGSRSDKTGCTKLRGEREAA